MRFGLDKGIIRLNTITFRERYEGELTFNRPLKR